MAIHEKTNTLLTTEPFLLIKPRRTRKTRRNDFLATRYKDTNGMIIKELKDLGINSPIFKFLNSLILCGKSFLVAATLSYAIVDLINWGKNNADKANFFSFSFYYFWVLDNKFGVGILC